MTHDYDLFVIGAGPGGLSAAKRAAKYGAKVAIAESSQLGGTCSNLGCIPKKLMVYAADFPKLVEAYKGYGWTMPCEPQFDWKQFVATRNQELDRIRQSQARSLADAGIEVIHGQAKFVDAQTLEINGGDRKITADKVLIAVGGKSSKPDLPGIEHTVTSDQMFHLTELPKRMAVLGGGYIGVEFSSMMHGLGVEVFLIERGSCILSGFDDFVCTTVRDRLQERGISVYCNTTVKAIEKTGTEISVQLHGEQNETLTVDLALCAVGRSPNLDGLGLEQIGVELDGKAIAVDSSSLTSVPNIYAVGDCTNRMQLTPVAKAEGKAFAELVFGIRSCGVDYGSVPSAVCSRPEAASVGLTEAQARKNSNLSELNRPDRISCHETEFKPLFHRLSGQSSKTIIKLVVNDEDDRVLGIHMVGDEAAEILQGFALAFQKGLTKKELDDAIGIHPSSAEEFFVVD